MSVLTVRGKLKEEHVADAEAAVKRMFAAIERERLGIRYASVKLEDGVTFLAVLEIEDGVENPLPALPEAQEFYGRLRGGTPGARGRTGSGHRLLPALLRTPSRPAEAQVAERGDALISALRPPRRAGAAARSVRNQAGAAAAIAVERLGVIDALQVGRGDAEVAAVCGIGVGGCPSFRERCARSPP